MISSSPVHNLAELDESCRTSVTATSSSSISTLASSSSPSDLKDNCTFSDAFIVEESNQENDQEDSLVVVWASLLANFLTEVASKRNKTSSSVVVNTDDKITNLERSITFKQTSLLEEVNSLIPLGEASCKNTDDSSLVEEYIDELDEMVVEQLGAYLEAIESMYIENGQSFEEAASVALEVAKLVTAVPACADSDEDERIIASLLDPITKFAMVLAALVHSAGSSDEICWDRKTEDYLAYAYKGREINTQLSADVAWDLLMEDAFKDLRRTMYTTKSEFKRFRQLFVQCVMATDVSNQQVLRQREDRWARAFVEEIVLEDDFKINSTVIVELVMQKCTAQHERNCCCRLCMNALEVAQNAAVRRKQDALTALPTLIGKGGLRRL